MSNEENHDAQGIITPGIRRYLSLEEEIAADIETILNGPKNTLYDTDMYRQEKHGIAILYPRVEYPVGKNPVKGPDHIRYLLSIYPEPKDLLLLDKIILRPRHIASGGTELMALYIRRTKTLVHYLYPPHSYNISAEISDDENVQHTYDVTRMINRQFHGADRQNDMTLPPLMYIISTLSHHDGDDIDKFFIKRDTEEDSSADAELDAVSHYYSQYGY